MRAQRGRCFASSPWRCGLVSAAAVVALAAVLIARVPPAEAVPLYARQTGQPCGTCHTDFAGLTPYGRLFKIGAYTAGGGQYRAPLFPTSDDSAKSAQEKPWAPPISMMAIVTFNNTQAPLGAAPYKSNDNVVVSPISFFYGGAITDHIGAFGQVTYNAPPNGGFGTELFPHTWTWDNTDLRYADSVNLGGFNVTYGITANNSPTVQDPWNSTPAWAFPYVAAQAQGVNGPPVGTILGSTAFAAHVVGAGAYAFINDALYLEATVYDTLNPNTQNDLGTDPTKAPGMLNPAPYWRAAFEPHWGSHWLEFGTFGMLAAVHPFSVGTATFPQTVNFTDIGFDTQYQYQGDNFWLTLRGSYIHENQSDPNLLLGENNTTNTLNDARLYASLAYGNDNRVILTGQYFNTWGSSDAGLYFALPSGLSPNSNGWIAELAYIPFMSSLSPGWPWFNVRLGVEYIYFNEFGGTTAGATANNTLLLYAWFAM